MDSPLLISIIDFSRTEKSYKKILECLNAYKINNNLNIISEKVRTVSDLQKAKYLIIITNKYNVKEDIIDKYKYYFTNKKIFVIVDNKLYLEKHCMNKTDNYIINNITMNNIMYNIVYINSKKNINIDFILKDLTKNVLNIDPKINKNIINNCKTHTHKLKRIIPDIYKILRF